MEDEILEESSNIVYKMKFERYGTLTILIELNEVNILLDFQVKVND